MRLYLAGPMSSIPSNNFPAFHRAAAELRAQSNTCRGFMQRRQKNDALDKHQPQSKKWQVLRMQIAALDHAIRLVAFEVEKCNELMQSGELLPGTRKSAAFAREVARTAPLDEVFQRG